ncbi:hypothetical protein JTE90_000296 [Oedothorax gibbosus]|uniref:Uncharacterized protein n=1 Tax=Oedothorax gibbosus TaxID=931172 RepID=A0AAV6VUC9_9ARAC|nr:hypothetical protein JTE90_000296 [Oedothorax gibbosus]
MRCDHATEFHGTGSVPALLHPSLSLPYPQEESSRDEAQFLARTHMQNSPPYMQSRLNDRDEGMFAVVPANRFCYVPAIVDFQIRVGYNTAFHSIHTWSRVLRSFFQNL